MTDGDDFLLDSQWTPAAREAVVRAADELCAAVRRHTDFVLGLRGKRAEYSALFERGDSLAGFAAAYDNALLDYTGVGAPFSVPSEEEVQADVSAPEVDEVDDVDVVGVVTRVDYRVTDSEAVLAAGRRAYLEVWPDDDEEDAAAEVVSIGDALYERTHAAGADRADAALRTTPGLELLGGTRWFVRIENPIDPIESTFEVYPFHQADGSPLRPLMIADYIYVGEEDEDGDE